MVKTNTNSKFVLKSLSEIRDSRDIILQIDKTDTTFTDSGRTCYLCEVVLPMDYARTPTIDNLTKEIITLNGENRRLRIKISRLERQMSQR